jgi:hypothetical protein
MGNNIKIDLQEIELGSWTGLIRIRSGQGEETGSCEHCKESSGSIKYCEIFDDLKYWLL